MSTDDNEHSASIKRLSRDLIEAAKTMSEVEARYLVDAFYISQDDRKRAHNQVRAMENEPHQVIAWLADQSRILENQIKRALDTYTDAQPAGRWAKSVYGIGPVLSAGLLAHIDIKRAPTVGHIYSFAGIAGSGQKPWKKGERRPYNAEFRTINWKLGQCFMKFSNAEECTYGHVYRARKQYEIARNDDGRNAEIAAQILASKKLGKDTEAYGHYSAGHLPPAQIDGRARRYAVKLFLSHLHAVLFWYAYQRLPANPYAIDHLGHTHFAVMPNIELVPGLREALHAKGFV